MGARLANVFRLGVKELYSLRADPILLVLILYCFTLAVYSQATGAKYDVENVSVGIVDEDDSELSRRIAGASLEPYFKPAVEITADQIDPGMNSGRLVFVLEIPPKFGFDALAGRRPTAQIDVDATAVSQAGIGATYLQNIIAQETLSYLQRRERTANMPINFITRTAFNPNRNPVLIILMLLSGTTTPYESMPVWVQNAMEFTPTTHFVSFAQSVLYRGAGFDIVWGDLAALAAITLVFFGASLMRFRTTIASFQ